MVPDRGEYLTYASESVRLSMCPCCQQKVSSTSGGLFPRQPPQTLNGQTGGAQIRRPTGSSVSRSISQENEG